MEGSVRTFLRAQKRGANCADREKREADAHSEKSFFAAAGKMLAIQNFKHMDKEVMVIGHGADPLGEAKLSGTPQKRAQNAHHKNSDSDSNAELRNISRDAIGGKSGLDLVYETRGFDKLGSHLSAPIPEYVLDLNFRQLIVC